MEQFEVIFYDEDEKTVLDRQLVESGKNATYQGVEPYKAPINGVTYRFIGWVGEENLENVTQDLAVVAKFEADTQTQNKEEAFLKASYENAKETNLNATIEAGQKVKDQRRAAEKDKRSPEEIVNDILKNGKTEVGVEQSKDDVEK